MNITGDTKIYRKDFNGRPSYSRCIASQEYKDGKKGDWIRMYEPVQFPKGTEIPDRSIVRLEGFEAVFDSKYGVRRKLVVQKYEIMDAPKQNYDRTAEQEVYEGFVETDDVPF